MVVHFTDVNILNVYGFFIIKRLNISDRCFSKVVYKVQRLLSNIMNLGTLRLHTGVEPVEERRPR